MAGILIRIEVCYTCMNTYEQDKTKVIIVMFVIGIS